MTPRNFRKLVEAAGNEAEARVSFHNRRAESQEFAEVMGDIAQKHGVVSTGGFGTGGGTCEIEYSGKLEALQKFVAELRQTAKSYRGYLLDAIVMTADQLAAEQDGTDLEDAWYALCQKHKIDKIALEATAQKYSIDPLAAFEKPTSPYAWTARRRRALPRQANGWSGESLLQFLTLRDRGFVDPKTGRDLGK